MSLLFMPQPLRREREERGGTCSAAIEPARPAPRAPLAFAASAGPSPLGFRLQCLQDVWVDAALVSPAANECTVEWRSLLSASALAGANELHIHSYLLDLDFLCLECPAILQVPRVFVIHGATHSFELIVG